MDYFDKLADRVEELLLTGMSFADAAHDSLEEMPPGEYFSLEKAVQWIATTEALPMQQDLDAEFGDAALTVVTRDDFHVQLLSWADASTTIHEHSFSGAFTVVEGSSVHVTYDFEIEDRATPYFVQGRLRHRSAELLRVGEVRRILPGSEFIHCVFHLERPSVSLVIRTTNFEVTRPVQLAYTPTLGIDLFRKDRETLRKQQHLELYYDCYPEKATTLACAMLKTADACQSYALLETVLKKVETLAALRPLLGEVVTRHRARASGFAESLQSVVRSTNIIGRREILTAPDHRLLLALLLTAPDRQTLLQLTSAAHKDREPVSLLCQWLRELSAHPVPLEWGSNGLGIDLSEVSLRFLEAILRGEEPQAAALRTTSDSREQAILELTLPRCSILKPLFAT